MAAKSVLQRDLFAKPKRVRMPAHEDREQIAVVQWLTLAYPHAARYLLHVPNGGRRGKLEAIRFKAMGVKPGVPDLLLLWPAQGYHGLALEMKPTGATWCKVKVEQRLWLARLHAVGYRAEVAYGFEEAREILQAYLDPEGGRKGPAEAQGDALTKN